MSSEKGETRLRILEATRELLEHEGAAAVRLEDVARKAGVSRQAVYLHFGSRAGLLIATAMQLDLAAGSRARIQQIRESGKSAVDKLDAHLEWWTNYLPEIRGVAHALLAERAYDEAANAAWEDRNRFLRAAMRGVVDDLAKEDALDPRWKPAEAADWLWALISVQLYEMLRERGWSQGRYADRLRRVVHAVLLAD